MEKRKVPEKQESKIDPKIIAAISELLTDICEEGSENKDPHVCK